MVCKASAVRRVRHGGYEGCVLHGMRMTRSVRACCSVTVTIHTHTTHIHICHCGIEVFFGTYLGTTSLIKATFTDKNLCRVFKLRVVRPRVSRVDRVTHSLLGWVFLAFSNYPI